MQRKISFCFVLVLFCMCFLSACQTAKRGTIQTTSTIEEGKKKEVTIYNDNDMVIRLRYGFCGIVQKNQSMPMEVTIETNRQWEGSIKVLIPVSEEREACYETKIKATKGTSVQNITIPSMETVSYFKVSIDDEDSRNIVTTKVQTGIDENDTLYMGVLSDDASALQYFDGMTKQKGERKASISQVQVSADELPDKEEWLSALDYLLVNQFCTDELSKEQISAIQKWVEQGGIFIVGTGGDDKKTLNSLINCVATAKKTKKEYVSLALSNKEKIELQLNHTSIELQKNSVSQSIANDSIFQKVSYGKGYFCLCEIDLSDSILEKYTEEIAQNIINDITTKRYTKVTTDKAETIQSLSKVLSFNYEKGMPNIFIYICLFIVYIGLIGPTTYFILKHFDKKTYFFVVVCLLSFIFTALVFRVSSDYKKKKPTTNLFTVINEEEAYDTIYMSSQNSKKKGYTLQLPTTITSVQAIPSLTSLYGTDDLIDWTQKETEYAITKKDNACVVQFMKKPVLEQNLLRLTKEKQSDTGRLSYKLQFDEDTIRGNLKNNTKYDFSYLLFYYQKTFWVIKDFSQGAMAYVKNEDVELLDLTNNEREYFISDTKFPTSTKQEKQALNSAQKILAFLYDDILKNTEEDKAYFIGILAQNDDSTLQDNNFEVNEQCVYVQSVSKDEVKGNTVMDILQLYLQKTDGDIYSGILYSKSAKLSYQFDDEIGQLIRLNDYYEGKIYAYNYETKRYDRILKNSQDRMTSEDVKKYIDEDGNMKIQLKTDADYTQLPVIAMTQKE